MLHHIVTWKLAATDEATKAEHTQQIIDALSALPAKIPEIKSFEVGRNIIETPKSWDIGLTATFDDVAGHDAYQVHPDHKAAGALVSSLASDRTTIDFLA